ncbi:sigma-54-dependent Fis family transcriptional regulator [Acidisoma cellulosilytica]|uniref:Sigma-54-dependent Fis family transcriptional regulator n=1 Tax=Acidisoma cellulosilyticum TaxID=2802395 RepID=A0A963Z396_9PROT|nr:GAF domain-containing protein [Acidisoma cellulosilyticum]MCB8882028.1 sigma-54-dependent Fis family transcriptional regulator [Acidisoma cellulosilyticum]
MSQLTPSRRLHAQHHTDRVLSVLERPSDGTGLSASWRRCLLHYNLDPERAEPPTMLSGMELRHARGYAGRLIHVADRELDRLHRLTSGLGYAVLMTDSEGVILARRVQEIDEGGCRHWQLWTGALWSEAVEGTNGVGTCLAEQRPVTVHRDQHFRSRHTKLTCTVAPLFDAGGEVAGALDISSFRPDPEGNILPLAMAAVQETARRIEQAYFHEVFARCLILSLPEDCAADNAVSVPLVALDGERRIMGATRAARRILNLDAQQMERGVSLGDALGQLPAEPYGLAAAEKQVLAGALAAAQGNVSAAAALLGISRATLHRKIKRLKLQREGGFR